MGEQRLRWIGGGLGCFSRHYNNTHKSLRAVHVLHVLTFTAMAKELSRLKKFGIIPSEYMIGSIYFTSEGRIRAVIYMPCLKCSCSELKLAKHMHTFFVLIRSGFELVTVLISKQSFFQHPVWPV